MLTKEELKAALPKHLKTNVSDELVQKMNALATSDEEAIMLRDNIISYTTVLQDGKFKLEDYINAVVYASHKMTGHTNQDAWKKTFPERYQALVAKGADAKEISVSVAGYNKNKLVNLIMDQALIPIWLLNQDAVQEAINTQVRLMRTATSEKVQVEAANSILTHLKRPETRKVEIDLSVKDNSGMDALRASLAELANMQLKMIESGMSTRDIAHQTITPMKDVTPPEP